ncbi:hypothetical protein TNCV_402961 [Trichonephila clavipes]|nr:hypothetical protein TNCV_402961 [Trichonephila clavipes]
MNVSQRGLLVTNVILSIGQVTTMTPEIAPPFQTTPHCQHKGRVAERCTLNLSRAQASSRWCGLVVRRGGASSGVVHVT